MTLSHYCPKDDRSLTTSTPREVSLGEEVQRLINTSLLTHRQSPRSSIAEDLWTRCLSTNIRIFDTKSKDEARDVDSSIIHR